MKKIVWNIEKRELPNYGVMKPGQEYLLPNDVANNLIAQGHAREPAKAKKKKQDKED